MKRKTPENKKVMNQINFKDMRTKTPKQIHEQWQRIKGYVRARGSFMAYFKVYAKYYNRMAIYNGKPTYWLVSRYYYDKQNNNPVPVSYYKIRN